MIYIIIGLFVGFILVGWLYDFYWDSDSIPFLLLLSVLIIVIAASIGQLTGVTNADYNTYSENYDLKEIYKNQYCTSNTDGNSISVWIMNDNKWKKKTFPEEKVIFQPTAGEAEVRIEIKKIEEPSITDKIIFFKTTKGQKKEIVKSVVISIPED